MISDTITVYSEITEKMYHAYMNFHVYRREKSWIHLPLFACALIVFGICNFLAKSPLLGWIFISLAVYLIVSRFLRFYMSINRISAEYQLSSAPRLFYTVALNGSQIRVANERENATYTWGQIYRAYRQQNVIYLYFNPQTAFLLPFSHIEGGTGESLWQLICDTLPSDKRTDCRKTTGKQI